MPGVLLLLPVLCAMGCGWWHRAVNKTPCRRRGACIGIARAPSTTHAPLPPPSRVPGLPTGADYPALLDRLAAVVLGDEWSGEEMSRLATDTFAGPFLQALLRACTHNQ